MIRIKTLGSMVRNGALFAVLGAILNAGPALACGNDGHGPDFMQVTGVDRGDTLNVRAGPSTRYRVVDKLLPNTGRIKIITCAPNISRSERAALRAAGKAVPSCWCEISHPTARGWVNARFLQEDGGTNILPGAKRGAAAVFSEFLQVWQRGDFYREPQRLDQFVTPPLAGFLMQDHGHDIVFDGQDSDISDLHFATESNDGQVANVVARYRNFGKKQHIRARMVRENTGSGPAWRISRLTAPREG